MKEICLDVNCFNLKYTVECGQCFRWQKYEKEDNTYIGIIRDRVLKVRQDKEKLYIISNKCENLKQVVIEYFDLDTNYDKIEKIIVNFDEHVKKAVSNTSGIRILNQDFFETLMSYIISANNNIPRISKAVNEISKRYGTKVRFLNEEFYLFPTVEQLKNVKIEDYRKCGVGFRDSYLYGAVQDIINQKYDFKNLDKLSTLDLRNLLLNLKGVGPKVADCILLFSCKRGEVFPIDVWVERVMSVLYFKDKNKAMKKKEILEYANNNFKEYAGIVQQHLFYNMRENML